MRPILTVIVGLFLTSDLHVSAADPVVRVSIVLHGSKVDTFPRLNQTTAPDTLDLGQAEIGTGKTANLCALREFPYPTDFEKPTTARTLTINGDKISLAVPLTPREFVTEDLGWSIDLQSRVTDGLVCLRATSVYTTLGSEGVKFNKGIYGENTGPIYGDVVDSKTGKSSRVVLAENRAVEPTFEKSVTPFLLYAKPGKTYTVKLQRGDGWVDATVKCEIL